MNSIEQSHVSLLAMYEYKFPCGKSGQQLMEMEGKEHACDLCPDKIKCREFYLMTCGVKTYEKKTRRKMIQIWEKFKHKNHCKDTDASRDKEVCLPPGGEMCFSCGKRRGDYQITIKHDMENVVIVACKKCVNGQELELEEAGYKPRTEVVVSRLDK